MTSQIIVISIATNSESFFSSYKFNEISVQKTAEDILFDSLQPLNITQILVQEYEAEIDYASAKAQLVDIYYVLSNLAILFDKGADIRSSLLDIDVSLTRLYGNNYTKLNSLFDCKTNEWWDIAFCVSLLHVCRIMLCRIRILAIDEAPKFVPNNFYPEPKSDNEHRLEYYVDTCFESAILLTKVCESFNAMTSIVVPILFVTILVQSTAIHMVAVLKYRLCNETRKYNEAIKRIGINLKFIESYRYIQAHTHLIIESLDKLKVQLLCNDEVVDMQLAFKYIHETLDHIIPSIYAKDVDMYQECEPGEDITTFLSQPNLLHHSQSFNMNEVKMLSDLLIKFAL